MRPLKIIAAPLLLIAGAAACQHSESSPQALAAAEIELGQVDLRQSEIVQSGNVEAMANLLHPAYAVHLPNGQVIGFEQTMTVVKTGSLARERHSRTQQRVSIVGDTGVVMGEDRLEAPPPLATRGERTRSYTNIYVRENGRWRHLARHFHFLP